MIVQNFYMLFIQANNIFEFLPKDGVAIDKAINTAVFFSQNDGITKDLGGRSIITQNQLKNLYLSLFDRNTKDVSYRDLSALNLQSNSNIKLQISKEIDFNISKIEIKDSSIIADSLVIPFSLSFCREINQAKTLANNCYTLNIDLKPNQTFVKLSDVGGFALNGKMIKRITTSGYKDGYMTLKDKSGKLLYNIPIGLFSEYLKTENILIDDYQIDFENSYLLLTSSNAEQNIVLTFYF